MKTKFVALIIFKLVKAKHLTRQQRFFDDNYSSILILELVNITVSFSLGILTMTMNETQENPCEVLEAVKFSMRLSCWVLHIENGQNNSSRFRCNGRMSAISRNMCLWCKWKVLTTSSEEKIFNEDRPPGSWTKFLGLAVKRFIPP